MFLQEISHDNLHRLLEITSKEQLRFDFSKVQERKGYSNLHYEYSWFQFDAILKQMRCEFNSYNISKLNARTCNKIPPFFHLHNAMIIDNRSLVKVHFGIQYQQKHPSPTATEFLGSFTINLFKERFALKDNWFNC